MPHISASAENRGADCPRGGAVNRQDQDDEQDVGALEQRPSRAQQLLEEGHIIARAELTGEEEGDDAAPG